MLANFDYAFSNEHGSRVCEWKDIKLLDTQKTTKIYISKTGSVTYRIYNNFDIWEIFLLWDDLYFMCDAVSSHGNSQDCCYSISCQKIHVHIYTLVMKDMHECATHVRKCKDLDRQFLGCVHMWWRFNPV